MTCRINNYILIICTKTWICPSWWGFHWECHILDIIVTIFFFNSETNLLFHKKYIQRVNKYLYLTLKFYFILWYYLHSFLYEISFDHFFFQVASVAYDYLPVTGVLSRLYQNDVFIEFLRDVLGLPALYRLEDPFGACSINLFKPGKQFLIKTQWDEIRKKSSI